MKTFLATCFICIPYALAVRMPIRRYVPPETSSWGSSDPYNFSLIDQEGDGTIVYTATVEIDGKPFSVQLDTGSSDLWVNPMAQNVTFNSTATNNTGVIPYLDGDVVEGPILLTNVQLGNFSVGDQAFINAQGSNVTIADLEGILGVGPPNLSVIKNTLANTSYDGSPFLENVFLKSPDMPSITTFQLNRSGLGLSDGGTFTIGEIVESFEAITNTTQLDVLTDFDRWSTIMDAILIDGKPYAGSSFAENSSSIPVSSTGKFIATMDTGTSLAVAPKGFVDSLYSAIPGAQVFDQLPGIWKFSCDTKLNVTLVFNGSQYPIHPIDLTRVGVDDDNSLICVNSITYYPPGNYSATEDFLLGDIFLRNVYILFNFGNYTAGRTTAPYMQLLSTTDINQAFADFDALNEARLEQWQMELAEMNSTTSDNSSDINPDSSEPPTSRIQNAIAADDDTTSDPDLSKVLRNSYIIIGLMGGVIATLLIAVIALVVSSRRRTRENVRYQTLSGKEGLGSKAFMAGAYEKPYDS